MTATDDEWLDTPIARYIWNTRYRIAGPQSQGDDSIESTWWRVARTAARPENGAVDTWSRTFFELLSGFRFLPGGRILASAGAEEGAGAVARAETAASRHTTLFNCFVMGFFDDDPQRIAEALREGALTMQAGGGVGYDFSTLRPRGTPVPGPGTSAKGVVEHLRTWDAMCGEVRSGGARRGAMLASLRCDHPDILEFLDAKREPGELSRFNLSVQVFDSLMEAVARDATWPLVFPDDHTGEGTSDACVQRLWSAATRPERCRVHREIPARELWTRIVRSAWETGEPGVLFVDRINAMNTLSWRERITTTNPCGEVPLPPYGACNLGSLNLTRFVRDAFTTEARVDWDALRATTTTAVRFLDNIIDVSAFPLPRQADEARACRRIGLGITGLADALIMLGRSYGSPEARKCAADVMRTILHAAYRASARLAMEKTAFPAFESEPFTTSHFVRELPQDIIDSIHRYGIRNSHLTAIAPAGTISLLAGNVSSGIEPVFDFTVRRRVLDHDGQPLGFQLDDYAARQWWQLHGPRAPLPDAFVTARELDPLQHLQMQAALQPFVDSAISKTINVPETVSFAGFEDIYQQAHALGLKGCTVFRQNPRRGAVLQPATDQPTTPASRINPCCPMS